MDLSRELKIEGGLNYTEWDRIGDVERVEMWNGFDGGEVESEMEIEIERERSSDTQTNKNMAKLEIEELFLLLLR